MLEHLTQNIVGLLGMDLQENKNKKISFAKKIAEYIIRDGIVEEYGLENVEVVFREEYERFYKDVKHKIIPSPMSELYVIVLEKESE